jgi:hypothetical protein
LSQRMGGAGQNQGAIPTEGQNNPTGGPALKGATPTESANNPSSGPQMKPKMGFDAGQGALRAAPPPPSPGAPPGPMPPQPMPNGGGAALRGGGFGVPGSTTSYPLPTGPNQDPNRSYDIQSAWAGGRPAPFGLPPQGTRPGIGLPTAANQDPMRAYNIENWMSSGTPSAWGSGIAGAFPASTAAPPPAGHDAIRVLYDALRIGRSRGLF